MAATDARLRRQLGGVDRRAAAGRVDRRLQAIVAGLPREMALERIENQRPGIEDTAE